MSSIIHSLYPRLYSRKRLCTNSSFLEFNYFRLTTLHHELNAFKLLTVKGHLF
jgi:hypothetical protein